MRLDAHDSGTRPARAPPMPTLRGWLLVAVSQLACVGLAAAQSSVVFDDSFGPAGPAPTVPLEGGGLDHRIDHTRGHRAGAALFHSLSELSVGQGDAATFTGPGSIDHVFGRVTGGNPSRIDGLLRSAVPSADLWLMNPQGVLFGQGASLEVDGSFHATTANQLRFQNGEVFEARAGGAVPMLAVAAPTAFGFLTPEPAGIRVEGTLRLEGGKTLELVGGPVTVDGGTLDVSGTQPGKIVIRGGKLVFDNAAHVLAVNEGDGPGGLISLTSDDTIEVANTGFVPDEVVFAPIPDAEKTLIEAGTSGAGALGTIEIQARELVVDNARIASTAFREASGGDVVGAGDGAPDPPEIDIEVETLRVRNWNEGKYTYEPRHQPDPENQPGLYRGVYDQNQPQPGGISSITVSRHGADAGDVKIVADRVFVTGEAEIATRTQGDGATGDAGSITIEADRELSVTEGSAIDANAIRQSRGNGGMVEVEAGSVRVAGGFIVAGVADETYGERAGRLSGGTTGSAGNVTITADSLEVSDEGAISVGTFLAEKGGVGGDLELTIADSLSIRGPGSVVDANGAQQGGSIALDVGGELLVDSLSEGAPFFAQVTADGRRGGDAGEIRVEAGSMKLLNGGALTIGVGETGAPGAIDIVVAGSAKLIDGGSIRARRTGAGDGSLITLDVGSLELRGEGSRIIADNLGEGAGGSIEVTAAESVTLDGAGSKQFSPIQTLLGEQQFTVISASTSGREPSEGAAGGTIRIEASEVTVTNGAVVGTTSFGSQNAGSVEIVGDRIAITNAGFVDSSAFFSGDAGRVMLNASESIRVSGLNEFGDGAFVNSGTMGSSDAGDVALEAPRVTIEQGGWVGSQSLQSNIRLQRDASSHLSGRAGRVEISGDQIRVISGGEINSSSSSAGAAGSVELRATGSIEIDGRGSLVTTRVAGSGDAGRIHLDAPEIAITNGATISSESRAGRTLRGLPSLFEDITSDESDALAKIGIDAPVGPFLADPPPEASGKGGPIEFTTATLSMHGGTIRALNTGTGDAGSIAVHASNTIDLVDSTVSTEARDVAGGNIELMALEALHMEGSDATASVAGGSGGNITASAVLMVLEEASRVIANAGTGSGGNISLSAAALVVSPDSVIDASSDTGIHGTVEINAPDTDLARDIVRLPQTVLDAATLMQQRCSARRAGERAGSFVWTGRQGTPPLPDGPLPAFTGAPAAPSAPGVVGVLHGRDEAGEPVRFLIECG